MACNALFYKHVFCVLTTKIKGKGITSPRIREEKARESGLSPRIREEKA